uniref:Uncharacterized protein n=1 Tax=Psilocybe cubensis TaxID=181762 RepID=A0A8H7XW42_PSICU
MNVNRVIHESGRDTVTSQHLISTQNQETKLFPGHREHSLRQRHRVQISVIQARDTPDYLYTQSEANQPLPTEKSKSNRKRLSQASGDEPLGSHAVYDTHDGCEPDGHVLVPV